MIEEENVGHHFFCMKRESDAFNFFGSKLLYLDRFEVQTSGSSGICLSCSLDRCPVQRDNVVAAAASPLYIGPGAAAAYPILWTGVRLRREEQRTAAFADEPFPGPVTRSRKAAAASPIRWTGVRFRC